MSSCADKTPLLNGLLDGELDAVNAAAFEAHLKVCEACNAEYLGLLALRGELAQPEVAYRAPDRLRANIEAMLVAEAGPAAAPAPRRVHRAPWAAGGAMGGLLAAGLVVMIGLPQVAENNLDHQLVANHVRSLLAEHVVDIPTSNQHVVRPWFNGKVDVAPQAPELIDKGFPLVGGRLDYLQGRVVPAIVYKRRAHTVNLFVWPVENGGGGDHSAHRDGYSLLEWTTGGLHYAAVSDIDLAELKEFRQAFMASAPPS